MRTLWLSSAAMTFIAYVDDDGIVVRTAPVAKRFIGQHVSRLELWLGRQGDLREEPIDT